MKPELTTGEMGKLHSFLQDPEGYNAIRRICQHRLNICRRESVGALQMLPKDVDTATKSAAACEVWESLPVLLDKVADIKRKPA